MVMVMVMAVMVMAVMVMAVMAVAYMESMMCLYLYYLLILGELTNTLLK